jgi:hypothetical protein
MTGEEIKRNLVEFARKWSLYEGTERAEAQTFLNELFAAYGQDRREVGAIFEEEQAGRFLDLIWPRVCLFEMKRPSEARRLPRHRAQVFDYWRGAADAAANVPAPRYLVLCAFQRFEIWEPGSYPEAPRAEFDLLELPEHADALTFLAGREPVFVGTQAAVTKDAVRLVTDLYAALGERRAAAPDVLRDFILQCVWCMFAEDLGQLESYLFTRIIDELLANHQRSSADDLGQLFEWLDRDAPRPAGGLYATTRYVNGGLFEHPASVHLDAHELQELRAACEYDWRKVEPHIFGSLLEGALGPDAQHELGAHYTHEVDIQKVVGPSITEPWQERIDSAQTLAEVQQLQNELLNFVVLDPACGSGNFLYIAYRALRRIEKQLHDKERQLRAAGGLRSRSQQGALTAFFPLTNIKGIEINAFAVSLARVTLWMAHKLAVDELDLNESTLPLEDLSGIRAADALRVPWPRASVIIGNPPFLGDRRLRGVHGDAYVEWLRREFGVGIKDYCVYWFRKTQEHLAPGQRAGLVGTNSISQNRARSASLEYIVDTGGVITNAVSTQPWPGDAVVEVSIVNWIKEPDQPPQRVTLDGVELEEPITPSLRPSAEAVDGAEALPGNDGHCFYGCILGGAGFVITEEQAKALLAHGSDWEKVIRPLLTGEDLTQRPDSKASRWVIDFGFMSLEEAMHFPAALDIVRATVKPLRDTTRREGYRRNWWRFSEPIRAMRDALAPLHRYIACPSLVTHQLVFCWVSPDVIPSSQATVFAFDDDYAMGVLSSSAHVAWSRARSSTLRRDYRYTPSSAFASFVWPSSDTAHRDDIARAATDLLELRSELCSRDEIGLSDLYVRVADGAYKDLVQAQAGLDDAVTAAYEWPTGTGRDAHRSNAALLDLNRAVCAGERAYTGPR